ncbi:alpha-L-fucosidase [Streptomyces sp. NBC_01012]|uniref:alpha-L-fucosidase n=1 Tax=Streptomyces sp. NBC_01012 TaxID=2903717 RepID=UPI00386D58EC|nr:alpha-L-fucosidase [Streptomyces sp. NBC_01012]
MTEVDFTPDALAAAGALTGAPDPGYTWPDDPRTRAALEHWQDLKVGVIMHWGIYAAVGQGDSWSLHRSDLGSFTDVPPEFEGTAAEYHTWYYDRMRTFTGSDYDASEWARVCADAGLRYLVLTTKHHDGYALWDSDQTNLKSTAEDAGLGRDIVAETFDAFRAEGLETGVYFSKADWSHPGYWDRSLPITDRRHNYDIATKPAKWRSFVEFTHRQIEELLTGYGEINVLWLDAGWVHAPDEPIGIDEIADRARELRPDILVVDREVHGPHENYRTPEQEVPESNPGHPWESCVTMTPSWCSTRVDEPAKPMTEIAATLVRIVARGGNYLIGVGPDATGKISRHVVERMTRLGALLRSIGPAVYGSRAVPDTLGAEGDLEWHLTRTGDEQGPHAVHALGLYGDDGPRTARLTVRGWPSPGCVAALLGEDGTPVEVLEATVTEGTAELSVPPGAGPHVVAVRLTAG